MTENKEKFSSQREADTKVPYLTEQERTELHLRIQQKKRSTSLERFTKISPEQVTKDVQFVQERETFFKTHETPLQRESKFYADVLELLVVDISNTWISGYFNQTSAFDDIARGTDLTLEILTPDQVLRRIIGVDVTSSRDEASKKLQEILQNALRGQNTELKYFEPQLQTRWKANAKPQNHLGVLTVPKVVIGAEREEIIELARLWLQKDRSALEKHRFGIELQDEIRSQCEGELLVAEAGNAPPFVKESLNLLLQELKKKAPGEITAEGQNGVLDGIREALTLAARSA